MSKSYGQKVRQKNETKITEEFFVTFIPQKKMLAPIPCDVYYFPFWGEINKLKIV